MMQFMYEINDKTVDMYRARVNNIIIIIIIYLKNLGKKDKNIYNLYSTFKTV